MASVVVEMSGDEAKLWKSLQRVLEQERKMDAGFAKVGQTAKRTGKAMEQAGRQGSAAFGKRMTSALEAAATRFVAVESAVRLIGNAMQFMKGETDKAINSFERLEDARRSLAQVATSAADLQQMHDRADALAAKHGVDRQTAKSVVFSARSGGYEGQVVEEIIQNAPVIDPQAAKAVASSMPNVFKGQINADQSINATLAAAQNSQLNFEGISGTVPIAAKGGNLAGSSPAETLALQSALADVLPTGEQAATAISTFGASVGQAEDLRGLGILGAVEKLQADPERREKFLGSNKELFIAYDKITSNLDTIREREKSIQEAIDTAHTNDSFVDRARRQKFDTSQPGGRLETEARDARRAEIERELANERSLAEGGFGARAEFNRSMTKVKNDGSRFNPIQPYVTSFVGSVAAETKLPQGGTSLATDTAAASTSNAALGFAAYGGGPYATILALKPTFERLLGMLERNTDATEKAAATQAAAADKFANVRNAIGSSNQRPNHSPQARQAQNRPKE